MANEMLKRKKIISWIITFVIVAVLAVPTITFGSYIVTQIIAGQNTQTAKWGNVSIFEKGITWVDKGNNQGYYKFDDSLIKLADKANSNYYDYDRLSPEVNLWGEEEDQAKNANKLPKDTFVRVNGTFEVACELYLKVAENDWPSLLKYEIDIYNEETGEGTWLLLAPGHRYYDSQDPQKNMNIYKYKGDLHFFDGKTPLDLHIFKNNQMLVNYTSLDDFENIGATVFSLNFSVWIEQTNFK